MGIPASRGMRDRLFLSACGTMLACGDRTGLLVDPAPDAAVAQPDARALVDASTDARASDATAPCNLGTVTGDVFGSAVYFANGAAIAPGRYRVRYVDGCMKYSASEDWSVNAYALGDPAGTAHWWFVSAGQQVTSGIPPGTAGFLVARGGYATFDECVQANLALPPVELTVARGPLAVWLEDDPYGDNIPGLNGRSPTWQLECAK